MKKVLLPICLFFGLFSLSAQEVPEVQKTLVSKISADWCTPCGTWGWDFFHDLIEDNDEQAVLMAVHHSGGLETPTSDAFATNFNIFGQPRFFLVNADQLVSSGNSALKRAEIKTAIEAGAAISPLANAVLIATLDGDQLMVNTKTRFFQNAEGEYYIGVYIIDDGYVGFQATRGNNAEHERVLRVGLSDNHFGELIMNGSIASGQEFDHSFSTTLDSNWDTEKLEVAIIIWEKEGNTYNFINTHSTTEFETATSTEGLFGSNNFLNMSVQPNISDVQVNVRLDLPASANNLELQLVNLQGQIVRSVFRGSLTAGEHQFEINRAELGLSGMYFIIAKHEQEVITEKVYFQ